MSALDLSARIPRLFRTYQGTEYQSPNCTIWEAVRATSAAPTFFKRIVINGEPFIDGGMGRNNPISQVLEEAELMFPHRHIACIISIGTGQAQTISIPKPNLFQRLLPLKVVDAMRKIATDCEESAQVVARRFQHTSRFYFRFNVEQGLQAVGLEQWERLDEVRAHTEQYIRMTEVNTRLEAAVAAIRGRQRVVRATHISTTSKIFVGHTVSPLVNRWCGANFPGSGSKPEKLSSSNQCLHRKTRHTHENARILL